MKTQLRLPVGETDPNKIYHYPDPDALKPDYLEARSKFYTSGGRTQPLSEHELYVLFELAGAYLNLTTYALGQECCVEKLRDIWRARRAKK